VGRALAERLGYPDGLLDALPALSIAGVILGNSMTSAPLAGDRLQGELRARADEIEARLALGFSGREAVQPLIRSALRAAMIPTIRVATRRPADSLPPPRRWRNHRRRARGRNLLTEEKTQADMVPMGRLPAGFASVTRRAGAERKLLEGFNVRL